MAKFLIRRDPRPEPARLRLLQDHPEVRLRYHLHQNQGSYLSKAKNFYLKKKLLPRSIIVTLLLEVDPFTSEIVKIFHKNILIFF